MHSRVTGANKSLLKIDVRLKILVLIGLMGLILSYDGLIFPGIIIGLSVLLCIALRVPLKTFVIRFIEPMVIVVVLVILKMLSGQVVMYSLDLSGFEINLYRDGFEQGIKIAARLMAAIATVTVVSATTPFVEFFSGLGWFRIPKAFIDVLMFALRYVRLLHEEAMVIYNAQKNRLGYCSIRRSFSSFGILAGSLVIKAFNHAEETTVAMKHRGYEGTMPSMESKPFKLMEILGVVLLLVFMVVLWKLPLG
jgi:cobalt/nickel transport system permease protein